MIIQQRTDAELTAFDQMARTSEGYQVLIDYLMRCMNTGALSACYAGGEEKHKISGSVIAYRDLIGVLLNAKNTKDEVARAMAASELMADRDIITP